MILYGRNFSPFVRRVGISLRLLGLPYEQVHLATATEMDKIFAVNPLGRVPVLKLDDGGSMIDSVAILDWLAETYGSEKLLMPAAGIERRQANQVIFGVIGVQEKVIASVYHYRLIPEEKRHQPWLDRVEGQALGGLGVLEGMLTDTWFVGGRVTQADIAVAIAITFIRVMLPAILPAGRLPRLEALTARMEARPEFEATYPR